jgi:hypothetical protein
VDLFEEGPDGTASGQGQAGEFAPGEVTASQEARAPGEVAPSGRAAGVPARAVATLEWPSAGDPIVRAATEVIGGPAGRRMGAGSRRFGPGGGLLWIIVVLTLLSAVTLGFGAVTKAHCRNQGWNTPDQFWHTCYSDIPVLYGSAGLGGKDAPSLVEAVGEGGLGQPPLAAAAMWAMSKVTGGGTGKVPARGYFDASAMLLAGALAVTVAAVALAAGRRPWDAAQVALAPVGVTGGLICYDLLAVALLAAALLAWTRRRPVVGGVLLGAATATRPITSVVLLAVLVLAARTGRWRPLAAFSLPALGAWLGIRLVLLPGTTGGLAETLRAWRASGPGYGSLWLIPNLVAQSQPDRLKIWSILEPFWYKGKGLSPATTTVCVVVMLVLVALASVVLGLAVADRPRLAHLALFTVGGTLLVVKSVPVQAGLVLLPLIALAGLRWRDHLIWATTELMYFIGVWLYIAAGYDANKGLPATFYLVLLLARDAGIGWLMVAAVRAMRDPLIDPVRVPPDGTAGADDPQGGAFEGSNDALVIRLV